MTATLDGRKVGYLHYQRSTVADNVVTDSTLRIRIARTDKPLDIFNTVREVVSESGVPLSFASTTGMSDESSRVAGKRNGQGGYDLSITVGPRTRTQTMAWPDGALLYEGVRRAIVAHGLHPGTRYELSRFDVSSQTVSRLDMHVIGPEQVDLPGASRELVHIRQVRPGIRSDAVTDLWVDRQGDVLKLALPMLGFRLELLACDRNCALQPDQNVDVLKQAMLMVPRPLPQLLREQPLRFTFRVPSHRDNPFLDTDLQKVQRFGRNVWVVDTVPIRKGIAQNPTSADIASNDWLQSDAAPIRALARKAAGAASSNAQRMLRMTRFVRSYMTREGASVGYASALEALRTRRGDCTEYAVLLAAMARAEGIPARVVTGLAYAGHYNGQDGVLVPHTWVQAWVNGAWQEYDAALPRYDRTHIAMATGNGDPWKYFSGIQALGSLKLLDVVPGDRLGDSRPMLPSGSGTANGSASGSQGGTQGF